MPALLMRMSSDSTLVDGGLDLRRVGHVQGQGRHACVRMGQGLTRAGVHPARAPGQGLGDERLPDAAIGPGYQHRLAVDVSCLFLQLGHALVGSVPPVWRPTYIDQPDPGESPRASS